MILFSENRLYMFQLSVFVTTRFCLIVLKTSTISFDNDKLVEASSSTVIVLSSIKRTINTGDLILVTCTF